MNPRITIDPNIYHGKPVIKGTRVLVSLIFGALAAGDSAEDIIRDYPNITLEDIKAALEFGVKLTSYESIPYEYKAS